MKSISFVKHGPQQRMNEPKRSSAQRAAMTLVELMVVIVILTLLVTAVLPALSPSSKAKRLREGARQFNIMWTAAQTKSLGNNRRYGLWFEKVSVSSGNTDDRGLVQTVFYCEEPRPYSGFSEDSAVILKLVPGTNSKKWEIEFGTTTPYGGFDDEAFPPNLLKPGDKLEVDGAVFRLDTGDLDDNGYFVSGSHTGITCKAISGYQRAWNTSFSHEMTSGWTLPKPYVIRRIPQKSATDPLQLPRGVAIDLEASGFGSLFFHNPLAPAPISNDGAVVIMFNRQGLVDQIYYSTQFTAPGGRITPIELRPSGLISFMMAARENVGESSTTTEFTDKNKTSWMNADSLWISGNPSTGRINTVENSIPSATAYGGVVGTYPTSWSDDYKRAYFQRLAGREFITSTLSKGGR